MNEHLYAKRAWNGCEIRWRGRGVEGDRSGDKTTGRGSTTCSVEQGRSLTCFYRRGVSAHRVSLSERARSLPAGYCRAVCRSFVEYLDASLGICVVAVQPSRLISPATKPQKSGAPLYPSLTSAVTCSSSGEKCRGHGVVVFSSF